MNWGKRKEQKTPQCGEDSLHFHTFCGRPTPPLDADGKGEWRGWCEDWTSLTMKGDWVCVPPGIWWKFRKLRWKVWFRLLGGSRNPNPCVLLWVIGDLCFWHPGGLWCSLQMERVMRKKRIRLCHPPKQCMLICCQPLFHIHNEWLSGVMEILTIFKSSDSHSEISFSVSV